MYWGASLGASLPGSNPHLSPRPRRRPSSPKFVPFPLGLLSGRGRAHVPGPSRRRYRVQRQHPHRCPAELALCNGSGSRDSKRTQLTRVGFSLFPFSVYIWYQVSLIRGSRCFFAGKDRKEWPSGSRRCGRGARGRPGWRGCCGEPPAPPSPAAHLTSPAAASGGPVVQAHGLVAPAISPAEVPLGETVGFYPKLFTFISLPILLRAWLSVH